MLLNNIFKFENVFENLNLNFTLNILFGLTIFVGIIGNTVNIIVFSRRSMQKTLSFRLLLYLSIIDLIIMMLNGIETFVEFSLNFEMRTFSNFFCKFDTFLVYFLSQARNVFCMGITLDRAIKIRNLRSLYTFCYKK